MYSLSPSSRRKGLVSRTYKDACAELADELGWKRKAVWKWFEECTMMRQFEQRMPVSVAAFLAWRDVRAMLDKRGAAYAD